MKYIKSFFACFSTYSRIPMPTVQFDTADMEYVMAYFPLIGCVIGIVQYAIFYFCGQLNMPVIFRTLIMAVVPLIITGGIHIDGYMDTMDAFSSYGDKEKKLSIMKDPHIGAFAVIYLCIYGAIYIAFLYLINEKNIIPFCLSFVISRIMSGISTVTIKNAKSDGMLHAVIEKSKDKSVLIILLIEFSVSFFVLLKINVIVAFITLLCCVVGYLLYRIKMIRKLTGITGDTSGYYLCMMELLILITMSIWGII